MAALALLALLTFGCSSPPPRGAEFAGCPHLEAPTTLSDAPLICRRSPEQTVELRVRLPGAQRLVSAKIGDAALSPSAEVVDGALQLDLTVPPTADAVQIDVEPPGRWRLQVVTEQADPALAAARAAAPKDLAARAQALINAARAIGPAGQADLLLEAGHYLHVTGDFDAASAALEQSARAAEQAGLVTRATAAMSVHAYHAIERAHRFPAARAALDRFAQSVRDPRRAAELAYMRGLAAYRGGDLHRARQHLAEAGRVASRWADPRASAYREIAAEVLMALGQRTQALGVAADLRAALDPADRSLAAARRLNNYAWITLLGPVDARPSDDPRPALESALAIYAATPDEADPCAVASTRANLALAQLKLGEHAAAQALVERDWPSCGPHIAAWVAIVEARLALARDPIAARARFERLAQRAEAAVLPEVQWQALVGVGEAQLAAGAPAEAITAWQAAEALLDGRLALGALGGDGERFLADRSRSARLLVDLLVQQARPADALCAARRARTRQLAALARVSRLAGLDPAARAKWDAAIGDYRRARAELEAETRDDWQRSADELALLRVQRAERARALQRSLHAAIAALQAAPRQTGCPALPSAESGERLMLWTRGVRGWIGFLADGATVRVARAPTLGASPEAQSSALLAAFGPAFDATLIGARRLVVLATGPVNTIPVHALPWKGRPLVAAVPVVYGVDLPARAPAAATAAPTALVIGDPRSDLRAARKEAADVAQALGGAGWKVERLQTVEARGEAVRAALGQAAALHYAGHGEVDPQDQWAGRLPLAEQTWLEVGDVLAAPSVPRRVVLSGCRTGLPAAETLSGGMSFAHAFLIAGSSAVVGATRDVADAAAAAFSAAFYAGEGARPGADPGAAFQRAALAVRGEHPDHWSDFRLWVP